jgi:hypothetical protein
MYQHKDVVRRATDIRVASRSFFVDSLLEALRPPLLRVMQNVGHCILSPLKKGSVPDIRISAFINMGAYILRSLQIRRRRYEKVFLYILSFGAHVAAVPPLFIQP